VVLDDEVGRVAILDLEVHERPVILAGHENLERLDLSPDGQLVATGTWRGTGVKVWDAHRATLVRELAVAGSADVAFSPDGRSLVTASGDEYAVWDVSSWGRRFQVPRRQATGLPGQAAFSPAGGVLAITRTRMLVQLVDATSGQELVTLEPAEPKNVSVLRFSPSGRLLVVVPSTAVEVWDLEAIRRGLESLGLDWPAAEETLPAASPVRAPKQIVVETAPWLAPLVRAGELARLERWDDAGLAFDQAIVSGARNIDAHVRRALLCQVRGDEKAYCEAFRQLLPMFEAAELVPRVAHEIAWACALGPNAAADYTRVVRLAELAADISPTSSRLHTLGAILYRAGRYEESLGKLNRAVALKGSHGTPFDALYLAMVHHRLGHENEARRWLRLGTAVDPIAMRNRDASGDTSWIPRLELEILRREARALIERTHR
jgi:tetratricopeptide (TPR) repeat protein